MTMPEQKKAVTPRLRFPEFRDAGPWEVKQINQISQNVITGGTPSTTVKEYWGGSIRWMNSGDLNLKRVYEVKGRITEIGLRNSSTKIIPPHCVLVGLAGQGKTRGTVAMNMVDLCINQSIAAIFPNDHVFYSDYLYHNLDSRYDELRDLSAGDGGRGGINLQMLKSFLVPLPSLPEQQKIADCLSSLDELIELQAKKLEDLKAHKKGLMQQLFPREGETTPRLRFPEFRDAGPWKVKRLGEVLDEHRKKSTGTEKVYSVSVHKGLVDQIEHLGRSFAAKNTEHYNRVLPGDVVYTKSPTGDFPYGIFKQNKTGQTVIVSPLYGVFSPKNYASGVLLDAYFESPFRANKFLQPLAQKGAKNTIQISNDRFLSGALPLPPAPAEQQKIADCLSSLDELIELAAKQLEALKAHKKGLMQQLFPQEIDQ